jgi:hypothetical protein
MTPDEPRMMTKGEARLVRIGIPLTFLISLIGVAGFVITLVHLPRRARIVRSVSLSGSCKNVNPDPVKVHLDSADAVQWTAVDEDYDIVFPNSPFANIVSGMTRLVGKGSPLDSGAVIDSVKSTCDVKNPPASCRFHYDVTGLSDNCQNTSNTSADPVVVVQK